MAYADILTFWNSMQSKKNCRFNLDHSVTPFLSLFFGPGKKSFQFFCMLCCTFRGEKIGIFFGKKQAIILASNHIVPVVVVEIVPKLSEGETWKRGEITDNVTILRIYVR